MAGERIKGETDLSYTYFCLYRDQSQRPRSTTDLADIPLAGKKRSPSQIRNWSCAHNWVERVNIWDAEASKVAARAARKTHRKELEEHYKRQFGIAKDLQDIVAEAVSTVKADGTAMDNALALRQLTLAFESAGNRLDKLLGVFDFKDRDE